MLVEYLERVATEYVYQRGKSFSENDFANFIRKDLNLEAKKRLLFLPFDLQTKASPGAGNWAAVPWLAFFDPLVTVSATKGFYVVYLINAQTNEIYLSLNQGTTAVYREFGESRGKAVLKRNALNMADKIPEFAKIFSSDSIQLGSEEALPAGYEAGHVFGRKYLPGQINKHQFYDDLEKILYAYQALVDKGHISSATELDVDNFSKTVDETRKYIVSRRIERNNKVRKEVLRARGSKCEACGLDPEIHFGFEGPIEEFPLDVHHRTALFQLDEGETRRYHIPEDFFVLCPTCHRMIHKLAKSDELEGLKNSISFSYRVEK
ncbi:DUF3578 domain-containing protein [Sulfitobacter sp. HNIBRBA3233]|uniref:MrcB family domain-containing protein n=1 Tax=Sulfitobacter marinivivus TaxID=3158558 RepID=UPI0032E048B2